MLQAGRERVRAGHDIRAQMGHDLFTYHQVGHREGGDDRAGEQPEKQHGDADGTGAVECDHRRRMRSAGGAPSRM